MSTHKILAGETISVSELRENPGLYFTDHPIAMMSHNHAIGYVVGAELFETMMALVEQTQAAKTELGQFRSPATRLKAIAADSADALLRANEEELGDFSE